MTNIFVATLFATNIAFTNMLVMDTNTVPQAWLILREIKPTGDYRPDYLPTNTVLTSDYEPIVTTSNGQWRITFKVPYQSAVSPVTATEKKEE